MSTKLKLLILALLVFSYGVLIKNFSGLIFIILGFYLDDIIKLAKGGE